MSDESDMEEHYDSGSEEDDGSHESDSDDGNHGLLDLEASEGSSEPDSDAGHFSDGSSYYAEYGFPKFMQLPPEIREMVWGAFCPDLGPEPRVFEVRLHTIISPPGAVHLPMVVHSIVGGPHLESQTEPMRAVMAVHRESRALGLKSAPHELSLSDGELVRYHEERDVLFVAWEDEILLRGIALRLQELGIEAHNLAFPSDMAHYYAEDLADLMYLLPQTRRLFILDEEDDLQDRRVSVRHYAWTVGAAVHKYLLNAEEEGEIGQLVPANRIFCWPDLDNNREFAEEHVQGLDENVMVWVTVNEYRHRLSNPLEDSRELTQDYLSFEEKTEAINRLQNIEVWPMVRFNFAEGLDRFRYIEARARSLPDEMSEPESSHDDDAEDYYDSSLIDDRDVDDYTTPFDSEDELNVHNLAQILFANVHQSVDDSSEIDELPPANFSSDEEPAGPSHVTLSSDSDDGSASQTRAARAMRRVVESDSDGSGSEAVRPPRPPKRRPRAAISESEDDDDEGSSDSKPVRGAGRRTRPITIGSDAEEWQDYEADAPRPSRSRRQRRLAAPIESDDEEDEDEEIQQPSGGRRSRGRVVQEESDSQDEDDKSDSRGGGAKTKDSGSSDEEERSSSDGGDDDDDDDDDPPPPKRMSLAKRLRMESRQARPQQLHGDDDSEADGVNYDGNGYSDDQEDEVDQSDSDMVTGAAGVFANDEGESEEGY